MTTPKSHYVFFETYISNLNESWKTKADMIRFVFQDREKTLSFITTVTLYYYEAIRSFLAGNYVASIALSSASVEIALNNEKTKRGWGQSPDEWLPLKASLKLAGEHGLPANKLLDSNFYDTRNKFVHGETFPFMTRNTGLAYYGGDPSLATEQLRLAHDFLIVLYYREQPKVDTRKGQPST